MKWSIIRNLFKANYVKLVYQISIRGITYSFHSYSLEKSVCCPILNFSMASWLNRNYSSQEIDELENPLDLFDIHDEERSLIPRSLRTGSSPHQVFIIHPYIKWGPNKRLDTTPELELEEAVSLVNTLKDWKVVSTKKVSLLSFDSHSFFGSGQLESVTDMVMANQFISAIFINVKTLRLNQHLLLEEIFKVPVFDRYSIVINIFKRHAISKEAKLQVSLAEIPYIRSRIKGLNDSRELTKNVEIGSSENYLSPRLKALSFHEQKLKKSIYKLRKNRELLRAKRKSLQLPVVAVVGYTNAGKTSLIKCLTQEENMLPENKLFATLDVTVHAGILPCNMKVLYVDTIGFISDIPTKLLEPFVATLEDAMQADLIVHVQDVSHPNYLKQRAQVLDTLQGMALSENLLKNIISVGNKSDKMPGVIDHGDKTLLVSCKKMIGLEDLEIDIEKAIVKLLGLQQLRIRVKNGGREYQWLHKEAAVSDYIADEENGQNILLDVTISKAKLEQFRHYFIRNQ